MRAVVQKVTHSSVTVDGEITGEIGQGLMVLLGVTHDDTETDAKYMAEKIANLRIFEDDDEKLNLSVKDIGGAVLSVSQFTLYGDCRKGRRPSFTEAALWRVEPGERNHQRQARVMPSNSDPFISADLVAIQILSMFLGK